MVQWVPAIWLVAATIVLVPVTRWFSEHVRGLALLLTANPIAAIYVYFFLLLPGTLTHEISHLLVAKVLGVRTLRLSLGPKPRPSGDVQFGAVEYQRADPLRESLVGLAPLLIGSALVLVIAHGRLGLGTQAMLHLEALPARLVAMTRAQDAWLWVYLLVAIANAMLPSAADRRAWSSTLIYLVLAAIAIYVAGALLQARIPAEATSWLAQRIADLAFAFTLTVLLDLLIGGAVWGIEALLGRLLRRRFRYS